MNVQNWPDEKLISYLEDMLPEDEMSQLEANLRSDSQLRERLEDMKSNHQTHSLGEIWQRHRLSCPSRSDLQQYQRGELSTETSDYIEFHIHTIGCGICQANFEDLSSADSQNDTQRRRQIFESSVGFLKPRDES